MSNPDFEQHQSALTTGVYHSKPYRATYIEKCIETNFFCIVSARVMILVQNANSNIEPTVEGIFSIGRIILENVFITIDS